MNGSKMSEISVCCSQEVDLYSIGDTDTQVCLVNEKGQFFKVNIPNRAWEDSMLDAKPHGLNLVFGDGCHYE